MTPDLTPEQINKLEQEWEAFIRKNTPIPVRAAISFIVRTPSLGLTPQKLFEELEAAEESFEVRENEQKGWAFRRKAKRGEKKVEDGPEPTPLTPKPPAGEEEIQEAGFVWDCFLVRKDKDIRSPIPMKIALGMIETGYPYKKAGEVLEILRTTEEDRWSWAHGKAEFLFVKRKIETPPPGEPVRWSEWVAFEEGPDTKRVWLGMIAVMSLESKPEWTLNPGDIERKLRESGGPQAFPFRGNTFTFINLSQSEEICAHLPGIYRLELSTSGGVVPETNFYRALLKIEQESEIPVRTTLLMLTSYTNLIHRYEVNEGAYLFTPLSAEAPPALPPPRRKGAKPPKIESVQFLARKGDGPPFPMSFNEMVDMLSSGEKSGWKTANGLIYEANNNPKGFFGAKKGPTAYYAVTIYVPEDWFKRQEKEGKKAVLRRAKDNAVLKAYTLKEAFAVATLLCPHQPTAVETQVDLRDKIEFESPLLPEIAKEFSCGAWTIDFAPGVHSHGREIEKIEEKEEKRRARR